MKKIILLTKSNIKALPEYKGYINTNLQKKYKLYFIGEDNIDNIKIKKESFGINITLPKQKSRWKFYFSVFVILKKINPSLVHLFWFPLAFIVPFLSKITFQKFIVVGDFRTKSPFGGIKGRIKDIILKIESIFFDKRITLDSRLAKFIFQKEADCYIPMGYDKNMFYDKKLEKEYDFVYAGSISKDRGIYDFIKDFDEMTNHRFSILVIGWGDEANEVELLSHSYKNITFKSKVEREEIPYFYSISKVGISYVDKGVLNLQQPTKILEYIACGNAILANKTLGTLELTEELSFKGVLFDNIEELIDLDIKDFKEYEGSHIGSYSWQSIINNKLIPFYEDCI